MRYSLKLVLLFLFTIFTSTNIIAQNDLENCDIARNKYLELNPDVARSRLDPWTHYLTYGKKEGRVWPSCNSESSKYYIHNCKFLNRRILLSNELVNNEIIIEKYNKINKNNPITYKEINGIKYCTIFYFSKADRFVHHGTFTESDLLNSNFYKFQNLEDCLQISELMERSLLNTPIDEESILIKTNVSDCEITTIEDGIYLGKTNINVLNYKFEKLKNKYLTISLKQTACKDTIVKIDKRDRFEYIRLDFKSDYLNEEFNNILNDVNIPDTEKLKKLSEIQIITTNTEDFKYFSDVIDDLEISICLKSGDATSINNFIRKKPYSNEIMKANKVVEYYNEAENYYNKAISSKEIIDYDYFLKNYKYSNHIEEIYERVVHFAVNKYTRMNDVDSLMFLFDQYIAPNFDKYKNWMNPIYINFLNTIEVSLIQDAKTESEIQLKDAWKKMLEIEKKTGGNFTIYKVNLKPSICNLYFEKLKSSNSSSMQDSILIDFIKYFRKIDDSIQKNQYMTLSFILDNSVDKNGSISIYKTSYLFDYLTNNILNYSPEFKYKDNNYNSIGHNTLQNLTYFSNKLIGLQKVYSSNNNHLYDIELDSFSLRKVENYYIDGSLAVSKFYENGHFKYQYDFENGVNISLKKLTETIDQGDKLMSEKNYTEANKCFINAKNNFPIDIPENIRLLKSSSYCSKAINEIEEEENKKLEKQREEFLYSIFKQAEADNNKIKTCHYCGQEFKGTGYSIGYVGCDCCCKPHCTEKCARDCNFGKFCNAQLVTVFKPCDYYYKITGNSILIH